MKKQSAVLFTVVTAFMLILVHRFFQKDLEMREEQNSSRPISTDATLPSKKETLNKGHKAVVPPTSVTTKVTKQNFHFRNDELKNLITTNAESKFGRTYKELMSIPVNGEQEVSIDFEEGLDNIASVVVASETGEILPREIILNHKEAIQRQTGRELFQDDWLKLDSDRGNLKNLNLKLYAKNEAKVVIYIQQLEDSDESL